jgi:lipopolysaccharide biosynthesis regulator YciM
VFDNVDLYIVWFQNHLLATVAVGITLILIYHYLTERDVGIKLSKRYRNSIFETQSKVFLNATQYLISGNRDLAIKEFLSAVDINRETIETYFALGGLFRSNGEIEKSISIHRSLIARENISELDRLRALKELAIDFDKGGFIDKAVETYKDVLRINRDQYEVIQSLCRIYEDIEDWDQAYNYRIMLSKVGHENQAETISHILVQKARALFENGDLSQCHEDLEDAFRFAPSVSAKILRLRLYLTKGNLEQSKGLLLELLKEHPMYTSFLFESLAENFKGQDVVREGYNTRLELLKQYFLNLDDNELQSNMSFTLTKVRILKQSSKEQEAYDVLSSFMKENSNPSEALKSEYIKTLIKLKRYDEVMTQVDGLLENMHQSLTKHFCSNCGYNSDEIFWRCPQCHEWETIQFRWKV